VVPGVPARPSATDRYGGETGGTSGPQRASQLRELSSGGLGFVTRLYLPVLCRIAMSIQCLVKVEPLFLEPSGEPVTQSKVTKWLKTAKDARNNTAHNRFEATIDRDEIERTVGILEETIASLNRTPPSVVEAEQAA
jgi:hypothetical protein